MASSYDVVDVGPILLGPATLAVGHSVKKKHPQLSVYELRALLRHLLDLRQWDEDEILAWSDRRQERNRVAKACHERRRRAELRKRRKKKKQAL